MKDAMGRPTRLSDIHGWTCLVRYDEGGNISFIASYPPGSVPGAAGSPIRVHQFVHRDGGVVVESDCVGKEHRFSSPRLLDVRRGTTISDHVHPGAPPTAESPFKKPGSVGPAR